MVVVRCGSHGAQAPAASPFLCKHTHGNLSYWKRRWCSSWIFRPSAPCSIQDSGSLVCGVSGHWDLIRYIVMLVKGHTETAWGGLENNCCTIPWGLGESEQTSTRREQVRTERTDSCRSSGGNCEKPLSVTAIKSCLGTTQSPGQKNLLLYWWPNNTWLLILIACCIYFY